MAFQGWQAKCHSCEYASARILNSGALLKDLSVMYRSTFWVLLFMVAIVFTQANALPQQAASATTAAISPEDVKLLLQRLQDLEGQVAALKIQVKEITEKPSN